MYTDSIEGLTPRKKIRVRNYPNSQDAKMYLEVKISSVDGRFKTRKIILQTLTSSTPLLTAHHSSKNRIFRPKTHIQNRAESEISTFIHSICSIPEAFE